MRLIRSVLVPLLLGLLFVLQASPAHAQFGGQFGASVAVQDDEVFVLKPGGTLGGLAAVFVFHKENGSWTIANELNAQGTSETGEGLSPSMAILEDAVLVASADATLSWAAYAFTHDMGRWDAQHRVPLNTSVEEAPNSLSLMELMRFMQPPQRVLAAQGDHLALTVMDPTSELEGVHLFSRTEGKWTREGPIELADAKDGTQFGRSLAWGADFLIVGAPGISTAYVFEETEDGAWSHSATLTSDKLPTSSLLSRSIAVSGNRVLLGAQGISGSTGHVVLFERNSEHGSWEEVTVTPSPDPAGSDLFGRSVAFVGDEIWVGAPLANSQHGTVYRFSLDAENKELELLGTVPQEGQEGAWLFGLSIGGNNNLAVVGAPGADGNDGRAALLTRSDNGEWIVDDWVRPDEPLQPITGSESKCTEGNASGYDCEEVDLLAFLPIDALGGSANERISDIWGWSDPLTDHEYALIGRTGGAAIVDVTNPTLPVFMGLVPANPTNTRDLKVYQNHLYFTGDGAGDHGLVVFDLTRLRSISNPPQSLAADTVYHGIASAHNLIIDEQSGFAYPVGASGGGETCGGGLHIVDIREPLKPTFAGCYTDTIGLLSDGRTHDGQCVVYSGPDERYTDRQICMVSNETGLRIVDITDKENPEPLSVARYPRVGYVHQGWLTEDHRYFYLSDELDELVGMTSRTRTIVWDVAELDDPVLVGEFQGNTTASDHNLFIKGDRMYQANYQAGLRVWDVSNPEEPVEIGHFDTTPNEGVNPPGFWGAWTAYPFFESGTVIVSSIDEGLFIVKPRQQEQMP